jgi:cyclase
MTVGRRVIACLDVDGGRVVKGERFVALRDIGDPAALAAHYEADGADEVVLLDVSATHERRGHLLDVLRRAAEALSIPLTVGGGITSSDDIAAALRAGADKVSVNTAAVRRPAILTEGASRFGAQCMVASIDARRTGDTWHVCVAGGRLPVALDAVEWARECARRGAGEILLTSIDRDGVREGYDLELLRAVSGAVDVPVIASGGAGTARHLCDAVLVGGADAVLVAGILHDGVTTVAALKAAMAAASIPVREVAA